MTTIPPYVTVTTFTDCCDSADDIWPGEPAYQVEAGVRCLICQAQITPWVPNLPANTEVTA